MNNDNNNNNNNNINNNNIINNNNLNNNNNNKNNKNRYQIKDKETTLLYFHLVEKKDRQVITSDISFVFFLSFT